MFQVQQQWLNSRTNFTRELQETSRGARLAANRIEQFRAIYGPCIILSPERAWLYGFRVPGSLIMKSMEKTRARRPDSTRSREMERGKVAVVDFGTSVINKAETEIRGPAIEKKAAVKGMGKTVFVPVTAEGKGDTRVDPIIERIVEVMGNREQAMRWLGTPVRALDFATPISLMATSSGKKRVLDVLGQMEHGVW
ncbi:MAG TPA: MbcA/ParS/Xre antitoxin family protein [Bryobacteraceae bacterium]|jgi:hypothetical protein|nr:MbcA/ParS/Xre antitoxin family protein [Bryobacteraceae bacterium]